MATLPTGQALSQLDQLGQHCSCLLLVVKIKQQHTTDLTENNWSLYFLRPALSSNYVHKNITYTRHIIVYSG